MAARQSRAKRAPPSQQDSEPPVFISLDPASRTGQLSGSTRPQEACSQRGPEVLEQAQPVEGAAHSRRETAQQSSKAGKAKKSALEVMAAAAGQTVTESEPAREAFDAGAMRASLRDLYSDMVNEAEPASSAGSQRPEKRQGRAVDSASMRNGTGSGAQQEVTQHRSMRSRSSSSPAGAQAGKQRSGVPEQSRATRQYTAASESAFDTSPTRSRSRRDRASLYGSSTDAEPRPEQHPKRERDRKRIEELRAERREVSSSPPSRFITIALALWFDLEDLCVVN